MPRGPGFSFVVTLGVVTATGARLARPLVGGLALGSLAGLLFVHWLAFQSLYRIGAVCPWCMVEWAVTIPIAAWAVLGGWRELHPSSVADTAWSVRHLIVVAWYLLVVVLALVQFWECWRTLL